MLNIGDFYYDLPRDMTAADAKPGDRVKVLGWELRYIYPVACWDLDDGEVSGSMAKDLITKLGLERPIPCPDDHTLRKGDGEWVVPEVASVWNGDGWIGLRYGGWRSFPDAIYAIPNVPADCVCQTRDRDYVIVNRVKYVPEGK